MRHEIPYMPVSQTGDATGGPEQPISKPLDKPAKKYTANETVPQENFHAEAPPGEVENPGSFAKRFVR